MGYTHYHTQQRSFSPTEWLDVTAAFFKIRTFTKTNGIDLDDESDYQRIFLNGVGDDAHETFVISQDHDSDNAFCKTDRKPYDLVVCMILLACHNIAPGALKIASDGLARDWNEARSAYRTLFGVQSSLPWV